VVGNIVDMLTRGISVHVCCRTGVHASQAVAYGVMVGMTTNQKPTQLSVLSMRRIL
jgi:hypothetical protein